MANVVYNGFLEYIGDGTIDLDTDEIKVCLLDDSYTPNKDTHDSYADLTHEVSGDGYTVGGQALTGVTFAHDDALDASVFDAENPVWTAVVLTNIRYGVLYKNATLPADRKLICCKDFGSNKNPVGVDFEVVWATAGILIFAEQT